MRQYIWFHPNYISEVNNTSALNGQKEIARAKGYSILEGNTLGTVTAEDHLTIVASGLDLKADPKEDKPGLSLQGETCEESLQLLETAGLKTAPKILTLECSKAAVPGGIAKQLSKAPLFRDSVIEASTGIIGRNPGTISWNMTEDTFGRVVLEEHRHPWLFFHNGRLWIEQRHARYKLEAIVNRILALNIMQRQLGISFFKQVKDPSEPLVSSLANAHW